MTEKATSSAFDPENYGPVSLIMMMRLYDLGLALLSAVDVKKANELIDMHEKGLTFAPAPAFVEFEEKDEETQVPAE